MHLYFHHVMFRIKSIIWPLNYIDTHSLLYYSAFIYIKFWDIKYVSFKKNINIKLINYTVKYLLHCDSLTPKYRNPEQPVLNVAFQKMLLYIHTLHTLIFTYILLRKCCYFIHYICFNILTSFPPSHLESTLRGAITNFYFHVCFGSRGLWAHSCQEPSVQLQLPILGPIFWFNLSSVFLFFFFFWWEVGYYIFFTWAM